MEEKPPVPEASISSAASQNSSSTEVAPPEKPKTYEEYLVDFDGPKDPLNPQIWTRKRKFLTVSFFIWSTFASTFASADLSPAVFAIAHRFHISPEVATLATASLFLCGYVFGPSVWAPLSELQGRKLPACIAMFGFILFAAGGATAKDTQTLMLCRFFQGVMGSGPLTLTAGTISDMYSPLARGYVMNSFAATVFAGPMLTPFIAGFTIQNESLGWRWTAWWGFFTGLIGLLGLVFVADESYAPSILSKKAAGIRLDTGDWAFHAKHEELQVTFQDFIQKYLKKPLVMLVVEPILLLISLYTAFIYALLYTFLTSYEIVFSKGYGFEPGVAGLPFLGILLGLIIAFIVNMLAQPHYIKRVMANKGQFIPEWLMPLCVTGAISFTIGLFWFGWTANYPHSIHWIVPTLSGLLTGYGLLTIFISQFTYLVMVYKQNAASAFGGNTIVRSALAAGFPLFATQLFENLGVGWGNTLLGCLAAVLIPVPVFFYFYGARIRGHSKYVP